MSEPTTRPLQVRYEIAALEVARTQDAMGRQTAMQASFANHQIGHLQNMLLHNFPVDITRLPENIRANLQQFIKSRRKTDT